MIRGAAPIAVGTMAVRPHIPVQCDCGARGEGEPGEAWRCAACGRVFRLPDAPEQVAALAKAGHDHAVLLSLTLGLLVSIALVVAWASAALSDRQLLPAALVLWVGAVLPLLGRRRRAVLASVQALLLR
jgi:hypothetical protein